MKNKQAAKSIPFFFLSNSGVKSVWDCTYVFCSSKVVCEHHVGQKKRGGGGMDGSKVGVDGGREWTPRNEQVDWWTGRLLAR